MMRESYDVVVIGGGPAGSTAAGLVAQAGLSALLVEREQFPRFHVGESLMPECYWTLQRLGLIEQMNTTRFTKQKSVQFVNGSGKESQPFYFTEHDPRECSTSWQVERADFDKMLFDRAGELGAECYDQTRVLEVVFGEHQEVRGVKVRTRDGQERHVAARVVMDASGQSSLLANKFRLREGIPSLRKAAIWGYYKDAIRNEGDNGGATIVLHTENKESWFWFIPLRDDVTSIGCVGDSDYLLKSGLDSENRYQLELDRCPGLHARLANAVRIGKLNVAKEYSYTTKQHSGQGWVLIGDAFGFLDPIYSSGVYFAMVMAENAADAVIPGFQNSDLSAEQLGNWCEKFKSGSNWIRRFVDAFYTPGFSFGGFMRDNPQFAGTLTDLLIGRIFNDDVGEMFARMNASADDQPGCAH